jgi:lipoyl(octanoyl) transferase
VSFRLLLHPRMEGQLDMAVDEALAEAVGEGRSPQVVRLYGFSPPTLSLGRFQPAKDLLDPRALAEDGVTLVRRPTGGHAVLHDSELTYSVILSKEKVEATVGSPRKRAVYEFIARILVAGLANLGVQGVINASQKGDAHNPDCFGSAGEFEIASRAGRKLIGSAQMTTRRAILQHGSIPWVNPGLKVFRYLRVEQPPDSHPPSCLDEETGTAHGFEQVRDAFAAAFRAALPVREEELSPVELEAARRILKDKYSSDGWNLAH